MKKKITIIILFLPFFALGQWVQIGDDIDGEAANDSFGQGLSISNDGNIVAIGGYLNDNNGEDSGHVRVYENIDGLWVQIGDDIDGEASDDSSGFSIDLNNDGNIIAIGARNNIGVTGENTGHVRVYENINGVWTQIGDDIDGEDASNFSGQSIDLSDVGNVLVIGAVGNADNGFSSGHARVYENIEGVWTQIGDDINGEAAGDSFGTAVSINSSGNIVAIGARHANGTGHVRFFENIEGVWVQIGDTINGVAANDQFGTSVSLNNDGNIVAIGAWLNDTNGENSGHVRLYENIGGDWTQIGDDINGEAAGDYLGQSVCLNNAGNIVAIGAFLSDGINGIDSGLAQVYENIGGVWTQIGDDIEGEAAADLSGISLVLSGYGDILAIGASNNDGINGTDSGHARVYGNASLSIEDNTFVEKINLYPNPTFGICNIALASTYDNIKLLIYDSTGKIIKQESYHNTDRLQVNTQNYTSGMYLLRIIFDNKNVDLKLTKR